jgi:hypothetical protein
VSSFDNEQYRWRETYFVCFRASRRPSPAAIERKLRGLPGHLRVNNLRQGDDGRFESITVVSLDDHAALDISYMDGDDVREQGVALAAELKPGDGNDPERIRALKTCDARFDVMHFEQIANDAGEEDELLDPSALLVVMEGLVELTDGIGVDPQSGTVL